MVAEAPHWSAGLGAGVLPMPEHGGSARKVQSLGREPFSKQIRTWKKQEWYPADINKMRPVAGGGDGRD